MIRISTRVGIAALVILSLGISLLVACGDGDEGGGTASPTKTIPKTTVTSGEPVVITIGNLTDLTGPASQGMDVVNKAVADMAKYYNDKGYIPGVELKVIEYDGQLDPSKDVPGYEWLKGKGADVIWTGVPAAPTTLKSRVDADKMVLFTPAIDMNELVPPGYTFCVAVVPQFEAYTFLRWIAENDWDYKAKGPAKIGGAGWTDGYSPSFMKAAEDYCKAHPDQFKWIGSYLTNLSFSWTAEVEHLRDCDYVYPPAVMTTFVRQYREAGAQGKFILSEPHQAFMQQVDDAGLWDQLDGTLALRSSRWWNEEGDLINLTKEVLYASRPTSADKIKKMGVGYIGATNMYQVVESIKLAVQTVGKENFNSEALYDATQKLSLEVDGVNMYSFSPTKRSSNNYFGVYYIDGGRKDLFRLKEDWYPTQYKP